MTNLTKFVADASALRVMQPHGRLSKDVGTAAKHFRSRLGLIVVGDKYDADASRGAYERYPLTIDGELIAELRDDASGVTIHLTPANHPNRRTKGARFTLTIVADNFGYRWDETVANHLDAMVHLQKSTGLPAKGDLHDWHGRRIGRWSYKPSA